MIFRIKVLGVLIMISVLFIRGCDPMSVVGFIIDNQTDTEVEVAVYGLNKIGYGPNKEDTTLTLAVDGHFYVFHEEQMGRVTKTKRDSIYFFDSLVVVRADNGSILRQYRSLDDWVFKETDDYFGEYRFTVDNDDF